MAEQITLVAETGRPTGSRNSERLRAGGRVPGIVYGQGRDPLAVSVDHHDLMVALAHHGMHALITLDTGVEKILTMPQKVERHPFRSSIRHIDFISINLLDKVTTSVGITLIGLSPGVKDGGLLSQPAHLVTIEALPSDVPSHIEVDISGLDIGDILRVSDLVATSDYRVLDDPETVIAAVNAPSGASIEEEEAEAAAEAAEAAEVAEAAAATEEAATE